MSTAPTGAPVQEYVWNVDPPITPVAQSDFTETGVTTPTDVDVFQLCNVNIFRRFTFDPPVTQITCVPTLGPGITIQQVVAQTAFPLSSSCQVGQFSLVVRAAFFVRLSNNEFITCQVDTTYTSNLGAGSNCFLCGPLPTASLSNVQVDPSGTQITADLDVSSFDVCICQARAIKVTAAPSSVPDRVLPPFAT